MARETKISKIGNKAGGFASVKEGSYEKMMESFSLLLAGKFTEYSFLMEGNLLKEEEKEYETHLCVQGIQKIRSYGIAFQGKTRAD